MAQTMLGLPAALRAQPRLAVHQGMPAQVEPDEVVPIEIRVANVGTEPAENVIVTDPLPADQKLLEAAPQPERVPRALIWKLGALAPGDERTLELHVKRTEAAPAPELRSAVSVTFETHVLNSRAAAIRRPELALAVVGPAHALVGDVISFQITATNKGTGPAHEVSLETVLPSGLSHPGGDDLENILGTLKAGESRILHLPVTVTKSGALTNHVRLCARGLAPVEREAHMQGEEIKLGLSADGPKLLYQNWSASFELDVHNEGQAVVHQVVLKASLPRGITAVCGSEGASYEPNSHVITWRLSELRPGEARSLLWNGVAHAAGEQVGTAVLSVGTHKLRQLRWKTQVVPTNALPRTGSTATADQQRPAMPAAPVAPATGTEPTRWHAATPAPEVGPSLPVENAPALGDHEGH